jgi:hypothetical protein
MSALSSLAAVAGAATASFNAAKQTYEAANLYDRAAENAFSSFSWAMSTAVASIDAAQWSVASGDTYLLGSGETGVSWTGNPFIVCWKDSGGVPYGNFGRRLSDYAVSSGALP